MHGIQGLVGGEVRGTRGSPSRSREEKVGISSLPTDITRRLPEAGGKDVEGATGRIQRNTALHCTALVAASAREAW